MTDNHIIGDRMRFGDLEKSALQLNALYEQLEIKRYGRIWTTEELALGFVGDVGDLAKLVQAGHIGRSVRTREPAESARALKKRRYR